MEKNQLFSQLEADEVKSAIKEAELNTSGEIRVHIEKKCKGDLMDRAAFVFEKLDMHKTELRNGILFYLAVNDKKFAILGDAGINAKVPSDFWESTKNEMQGSFKKGEFSKGLAKGIKMAGDKLKEHFPYKKDDVNELSDEISYGK